MQALILIGSYRVRGNTARLAALVEEGLTLAAAQRDIPLTAETINLGHLALAPCRGCRVCFDRGEEYCPHDDDFAQVKAKMQAADVLIIATPVYVDDVSGIVKTWIDRLAHVCHRPEFAGKCVYVLATTGSSPTGHARRTLTVALRTWGYHVVGEQGFATGARMADDDLTAKYRAAAHGIGRKLVDAVRTGAARNPTFAALLTFRIQQAGWRRAAPGTVDHRYWTDHGWLARDCTYFTPIHANRVKVALARGVGAAMVPFFVPRK